VNGPKDQAGGCLADLLFYGINIQIYALQNICPCFFPRDIHPDQVLFTLLQLTYLLEFILRHSDEMQTTMTSGFLLAAADDHVHTINRLFILFKTLDLLIVDQKS